MRAVNTSLQEGVINNKCFCIEVGAVTVHEVDYIGGKETRTILSTGLSSKVTDGDDFNAIDGER